MSIEALLVLHYEMNLTEILNITSSEASDVIGNHISVITFLIGTASFIMGLYYFRSLPRQLERPLLWLTLSLVLASALVDAYFFLLMFVFSFYSSYLLIFVSVTAVIIVVLVMVVRAYPVNIRRSTGGTTN